MTGAGRVAGRVAWGVAGALLGALLVLGADGLTRPTATDPPDRPRFPAPAIEPLGQTDNVAPTRTTLLAWATGGGIPAGAERELERMRGVKDATTMVAGLDWMTSVRSSDGTVLDDRPGTYAIPIEVAAVQPREYAGYVPPGERDAVLALNARSAVIPETEVGLRGAGEGLMLALRHGGKVRVSGVVSDVAANGYEVLTAGPVPAEYKDRYLLMHLRRGADRRNIERRIRGLLEADQLLRVRARGETPFLRHGDAVLPQLLLKETFGEFSAVPLATGYLTIERRWVKNNIVSARVPVLGMVTCHRILLPQIRGAMEELQARGLAFTVHTYSGCYSPRTINRVPGGRLSHHSWGMALDINAPENSYGTRPDQDARLVEIMERWGLTWGGDWLKPDGMHFEWWRFP